jgi:outer membrane protein TolC
MLRDQLRKITTARRQYELSHDKLLPLARKTTETLRINYEADTATFIEVLTVQRMLRDAEAAASTQLADYLSALAELEAIVGADPTDTASPTSVTKPTKRKRP